jgi:hypothetical protein
MFKVKFLKFFVNGTLKGLSFNTTLECPTLESAVEYTKFLLEHTKKPVIAYSSSHYTCHCIYIEAPSNIPKVEEYDTDEIPF